MPILGPAIPVGTSLQPRKMRFGAYVVDFRSAELFKNGIRLKIQDQPFQILATLLDAPGELVTREELQKKLWSDDTFVDFERGLNAAICKLRDVLNDSADEPRYIETLPRHGYRFIAKVDRVEEQGETELSRVAPAAPPLLHEIAAITSESPVKMETAVTKSRYHILWGVMAFAAAALLLGLTATRWRARFFSARASGGIRSVAVLPFDNLSGDPSQEYFADGMTDAVTTDLAQVRGLLVISRTSAMKYKSSHQTIPEIARELNVDATVQGSVLRSGNRVRVSVELVEAASDHQLWAKNYERDMNDVLVLQGEVATKIASEIQVNLSAEEQAQLALNKSVNPQAYEAYLKAKYFFTKEDESGLDKAKEFYSKSIQLDPSFAPAYTGLAEYYGFIAFSGRGEPRQNYLEAEKLLAKSLQLDPDSSLAHTLVGMIKLNFRCDPEGAEKELNLALVLNPSDMNARDYYSYYLQQVGRHDEAIREKTKVLQHDPVSVGTNAELGLYFLETGRNDEAIAQLKRTLELDPRFPPAHARLAGAYANKGQFDFAITEMKKAITEDKIPGRLGSLGNIYAIAGMKQEALQVIQELKEMSVQRYVSPADIALIYARLGQPEDAFIWLKKAKKEDGPPISDPGFDGIRSDPRFRALEASLTPEKSCPD